MYVYMYVYMMYVCTYILSEGKPRYHTPAGIYNLSTPPEE
jgi:hypothetical protein